MSMVGTSLRPSVSSAAARGRGGGGRDGAEVLIIRGDRAGGPGAPRGGPALLADIRAIELGHARARFGRLRPPAEILDICRVGRGGAGLLGVGPGLFVRRL